MNPFRRRIQLQEDHDRELREVAEVRRKTAELEGRVDRIERLVQIKRELRDARAG